MWEAIKFCCRSLLLLALVYFTSCHDQTTNKSLQQTDSLALKNPWALLPFVKVDSINPILAPSDGEMLTPIRDSLIKWEAKNVFNPAVVVSDSAIFLLYRAQDSAGISRIGLARSTDGLHFNRLDRLGTPVLFPGGYGEYDMYESPGGCEDPRVVEDSTRTFYMFYTGYDGKTARLLIATSRDLVHWTKRGPVFKNAYKGKYINIWSKSGSVVSTYKDGRIIATKINGKYWMYWGDVNIWAATSDDLINWTPVLYENNERDSLELRHYAKDIPEVKTVFGPRPKKFDSDIVEPGPPAMITDSGILLIYNSRNIPAIGDSSLPEGTYAPSQILLSKEDPTKVLKRLDNWFMKPEKPYEITGEVNQVCFAEGLAQFNGQWFLYYGTADSKIAVAIKK